MSTSDLPPTPDQPPSTRPRASADAAETLILPPARQWWLVLISGVLSVVVGILALVVPGATLLFLGLMFGISLVFTGVSAIAIGVSGQGSSGRQTLSVLVGFAAIVGGLFCFVRPGAGIIAVLLSVAFWFILVGIGDLVTAFQEPRHRIWRGLLGVIAIAAGIILVVDPVIGLSTLALLAGLGFLLRGITEVALALQLRRVNRDPEAAAA